MVYGFYQEMYGCLAECTGFPWCMGVLGGTGVSIGCTGANPFCVTHQPPQIGLQKELTGSYYFSFSTIVKLVSAGQTKR